MKLISHRGNLRGPNKERENDPSYIQEALNEGFDVEIDIWRMRDGDDGKKNFYLGHDAAEYQVDFLWLLERADYLWIHCKNFRALDFFVNDLPNRFWNYFWHQNDAYTITSQGVIWAYPGSPFIDKMIIAVPEMIYSPDTDIFLKNPLIGGICSDYVKNYRDASYAK